MRVLVACEESQTVTKEFRKLGVEAYSCDIQGCSGGHPEWHIKGDVLEEIDKGWDLIVAHPPCTRLCNSGVCWLEKRDLWRELELAKEFFNSFKGKAPFVAIENPIPHKYAVNQRTPNVDGIGKYTQIIQPYQFGHPESKATCLWLENLPLLKPTNIVKERNQSLHRLPPGPERAKLRSKTFPGIAKAMAEQWGGYILEQSSKRA
jgi:hypothetical protein